MKDYYKGKLDALESVLIFAEAEMENAEYSEQYNEAEAVARWLREAIKATKAEAKEAEGG